MDLRGRNQEGHRKEGISDTSLQALEGIKHHIRFLIVRLLQAHRRREVWSTKVAGMIYLG